MIGEDAKTDTLVSVVIATLNRAPLMEEALASLFDQTYRPLEVVVVVDDGSTDDTRDRVSALERRQPRGVTLHHVWQVNAGPAVARNRGIVASHGDHVLFMDDDDLMVEDAIGTWWPHSASASSAAGADWSTPTAPWQGPT